jgi:hypothetical protein
VAPRKPGRVALDLRGLSGRPEIFQLSGARRRHPAVSGWFSEGPPELRAIAREWFARIRQCGDDVLELLHDGCPVACVEDAALAYVNTFKSHVNVGFFSGAFLEDPTGLLEGSGKRMRHVRLEPGGEVRAEALAELIDAAYTDIHARLRAARASTEG